MTLTECVFNRCITEITVMSFSYLTNSSIVEQGIKKGAKYSPLFTSIIRLILVLKLLGKQEWGNYMKLKIAGTTASLLLLAGGYSVSAASDPNNGIPEQLTELQMAVT